MSLVRFQFWPLPFPSMKDSHQILTYRFSSLASTNDWSKCNAETFPDQSLVCTAADAQTAGRGQYGKSWLSSPGTNLLVTYSFLSDLILDEMGLLAPSVGRLVIDWIKSLDIATTPLLKWPNDLMIDNKKVAGILCETTPHEKGVRLHIGMGINVNASQSEMNAITQPATSLRLVSGRIFDRNLLLNSLTNFLFRELTNPNGIFRWRFSKRLAPPSNFE